MHFVYLEAGSGSKRPVSPKMVAMVKKNLDVPLIIGGGIRTCADSNALVKVGTDAIVTGTIVEVDASGKTIRDIIRDIKSFKGKKRA